ncbi:saccharopine dehydrogenase NADP-binding domain-containing protein [Phenylobacterium sp.]|uniref:saccharopine dehydrogenase family protein n=1 Tax=Phenylobacterium sp. TaxID=1871053 RepID=UPI002897CCD1|nr:saccharopine dehydrogenase NADP-binding domain-containing protein [Phenylobacterium sp.]
MNPGAEFDIIVYGATGFTGRLVAEHLAARYGVGGEVKWAMAGRSLDKLQAVRDEIGAPKDTPLIVADAGDPASVKAMVERTKAVLTTVGPYQLYGSDLVAACAAAGTDYLDLSGEPNWMAQMIGAHEAAAKKSGARILFSCGFDSIPFELGVYFAQQTARQKLGGVVPRVKGRMRQLKGGLSGGTAASGRATMAAIQKDPSLLALMVDPFALTPGFKGPEQPRGDAVEHDEDLGADVGPFMMAAINTKNVHRSNFLQGHAYGQDFVYDEMAVVDPKAPASFALDEGAGPQPGEGPSKEERETGFYDAVFIGVAADGRKVVVSVKGDKDPGYGSTSKIIAETAICLVKDAPEVPGGIWVPGAALGDRLIARLQKNAGLSFEVEA